MNFANTSGPLPNRPSWGIMIDHADDVASPGSGTGNLLLAAKAAPGRNEESVVL
jgi:hypothetical protein